MPYFAERRRRIKKWCCSCRACRHALLLHFRRQLRKLSIAYGVLTGDLTAIAGTFFCSFEVVIVLQQLCGNML